MKRIATVIIAAIVVLILASCGFTTKDTKGYDTYFWTSSGPDTIHYLYINDSSRGILPYLAQAPTCDNNRGKALHFPLPSGDFKIEVKDREGNTKYYGKLHLLNTTGTQSMGTSTDNSAAGTKLVNEGDCLIEEFWFR